MKQYRAEVVNDRSGERMEVMEFTRKRFTKREWKNLLASMFIFAADSIDNRELHTSVYENDSEVLKIACDTKVDGSNIWANIYANNAFVRTMTIAD